MHFFYTPDIDPSASVYQLSEDESKHAIRVMRLAVGDQVELIDGRGSFYKAEIADANPKRTNLRIVSKTADPHTRNHYLHIAIAPTKNIERLEWFLEKATEIGIDEISLIVTQRSERKEARVDRLEKIVVSAIKQSIKAWCPKINEVISLDKLIKAPFDGQKFITHCIETEKNSLPDLLQPKGRYLILIGPEGDFTPAEVDNALENGYKPITLGSSRLRTETAALEAVFEVNFLNR